MQNKHQMIDDLQFSYKRYYSRQEKKIDIEFQ